MAMWFNPNTRLNFRTLGLFFGQFRIGFSRLVFGPVLVPGRLEMQGFLF